LQLGDARDLSWITDASVHLIVTSPPYLNAIDYMRAHRMSLVWFGHRLDELREIRATTVGAERKPESSSSRPLISGYKSLSARQRGMLERYARDMSLFCQQIARKLKADGEVVLVVGDCTLGGVVIKNSSILRRMAESAGLELLERWSRPLPAASRYLPPPTSSVESPLSKRLRHEVVMRFRQSPRALKAVR